MEGIATTLTSWRGGVTRLTMPPRATFTRMPRGMSLGKPHDTEQQRRILGATLALLAYDAPQEPVTLDESDEE
jgi:hypothetical protein